MEQTIKGTIINKESHLDEHNPEKDRVTIQLDNNMWFSCWKPELFPLLQKRHEVEITFVEKGKYKNITNITHLDKSETPLTPHDDNLPSQQNTLQESIEKTKDKELKLICLKIAAKHYSSNGAFYLGKTIHLAKELYNKIKEDGYL